MKKLLLLPLVMGLLSFSTPPSYAQGRGTIVEKPGARAAASAPDIAPQPCDTEYWRQMSAKAWMESEREIMQNQNLIFKPDSVLEYVCFDQFVSLAAYPGGDIFVHTDYFGKKIIERSHAGSMNNSLTNVVSKSLIKYRESNFIDTFLGGRARHMNAGAINSKFKEKAVNQGSYLCETMSHIWKAAKCSNFVDNSKFADTDGFYPFDAIKKHKDGKDVAGYADTIKETRKFPGRMPCGDSGGPHSGPNSNLGAGPHKDQGAAGTWNDQITLATNKGDNLYKFHTPLGEVFKDVGKKLKPGECGEKAIETGIEVVTSDGKTHKDGVCTNPGCSYNKSGKCEK